MKRDTSIHSLWLVAICVAIGTAGAAARSSSTADSSSTSSPLGRLYGRVESPDGAPFNGTVKIALNHGERITYSRPDGSFILDRVPPGIHVLDVHDAVYHFSQFKVQLLPDEMDNPKVLEYYYPGATKQSRALPIVWVPLATYEYFEQRSGFSPLAMLKSPMILIMLFTAGMMFLMPKMMDNMEPEEKERMRKQMAMQSNPTEMISQLMSGDWSGLTGEDPSEASQQTASSGKKAASPQKKASKK